MLIRIFMKYLTSLQVKQIIETCKSASVLVSPCENNMYSVSACLKEREIDELRRLGYAPIKVPG
jgi:hypothetical protein